jgi:hypothetical protein
MLIITDNTSDQHLKLSHETHTAVVIYRSTQHEITASLPFCALLMPARKLPSNYKINHPIPMLLAKEANDFHKKCSVFNQGGKKGINIKN